MQFKKKIRKDEEVENKGFNIDGDMAKFLEHLDHHTKDLFQSTKEVSDENLPIIYNSLATVKSFISLLGKIILHEIDPISSEITLKCKGCLLHCPQNWSLTSPPGQPTANSFKKNKIIVQTLFVHVKLLANLLCIYQRKMCTKIYCLYTVQ